MFQRLIHVVFAVPCKECHEVAVPFTEKRYTFCDKGEGQVQS